VTAAAEVQVVEVAEALELWPEGVPDPDPGNPIEETVRDGDAVVVRNVSRPSLTPYLPEPSAATGTAVVVAPGGGFHFLAWDYEGEEVAKRLAERGVAAFLLKYRVADTGPTVESFREVMAELMQRLITEALAGGVVIEELATDVQRRATADAQEAVRLVRRRASDWGVDTARVGFLGFSAGAYLATEVALAADADARPSFVSPIYGGKPPALVPDDAPPLFAALAADDLLVRRKALETVQAWMEAGRPVELHLFDRGGHGFGARTQGLPSDRWLDHLVTWMQTAGFLPQGTAAC
jgi:acetyl esterase/lipase